MIGNRIYGCDDCLAACPWNRFAGEGRMMAEHHRLDLGQADLLELLALDGDGFRAKFRGTPMKRTKRRGVLRNVCVALGNVWGCGGDPGAGARLRRSRAAHCRARRVGAWPGAKTAWPLKLTSKRDNFTYCKRLAKGYVLALSVCFLGQMPVARIWEKVEYQL